MHNVTRLVFPQQIRGQKLLQFTTISENNHVQSTNYNDHGPFPRVFMMYGHKGTQIESVA